MSSKLAWLILACGCALAAVAHGAPPEPPAAVPTAQPSAKAASKAALKRRAPDFTLPDLDGGRVSLRALRGKLVVLEWFNP